MVRGECALSAVYCAGMARALGSARSPQRFDALAAIEQRGENLLRFLKRVVSTGIAATVMHFDVLSTVKFFPTIDVVVGTEMSAAAMGTRP